MRIKKILLYVLVISFFGINIDYLTRRIASLEEELEKGRNLSSGLAAVTAKTAALEKVLSHDAFAKAKRIHVFRSQQNEKTVDDTFITNVQGQTDFNWGANGHLKVGYDDKGAVYQILIKFNDLRKAIPQDAQILVITLYLRQHDSVLLDENALRETLNLYEVKRKWAEGAKAGAVCEMGESSWDAAIKGKLNWKVPGAGDTSDDFYKNVLSATTGPVVNGAADGWVAFSFITEGIDRLSYRIRDGVDQGVEDFGFLIQNSGETKKKKTLLSFYSSDYVTASDRPYIEIIYLKPNAF